MKKISYLLIVLWALYSAPSYSDEIRLGLGIDLFEYPELQVVPGYPVYYAPQLEANYFFYEGDYWVYQDDNWYQSSWYDGPWWLVDPEDVPEFLLRVPVRFYRQPPIYFIGWWSEEPPHWGEHWGSDWEQHRHGWDKWDHRIHQKPAPLPLYQRQYSGDNYPRQVERQHELHYRNYRYQSRDPLVQQRHQEQSVPGAPVQQERQRTPQERGSIQIENQRTNSRQQGDSSVPRTPSTQRGSDKEKGATQETPRQGHPVAQEHKQQPDAAKREPQIQRSKDNETRQQDRESRQQGNEGVRESNHGQGRDR